MYAAEQIADREFATAPDGYDPEQVRDFLREIADQLRHVEHEWHALRDATGGGAAARVPSVAADDLLSDLGVAVRQVLVAGEEAADRLRKEAERDAEQRRSGAEAEVEAVLADARAEAMRTFEQTRAELEAEVAQERAAHERVVEELTARRTSLEQEIAELEERRGVLTDRARVLADEVAAFVQAMNGGQVDADGVAEGPSTNGSEDLRGDAGDPAHLTPDFHLVDLGGSAGAGSPGVGDGAPNEVDHDGFVFDEDVDRTEPDGTASGWHERSNVKGDGRYGADGWASEGR